MYKSTILLGLITLIFSTNLQAQWEGEFFFPHINSLSFPTKDFGMASCENYYSDVDTTLTTDSSAIILSSDSGDTWSYSLVLPSVTFKDIQHTDLSTFFAVGYDTSNEIGVLAQTKDGGNSWDTTAMDAGLLRVSFPSDSVGYILSSDTFLYKTVDSGVSWTKLPHNIIDSALLPFYFLSPLLHFVNDTTGFASLESNKLYKTNDGGLSWSLIQLDNSMHIYSIKDLTFIENDSIGYLIMADGNPPYETSIYKSTDLGESWTAIENLGSSIYLYTISFPHRDTGYIGGFFTMYKTVDGGNNWFRQYSSNRVFSNIDFNDWVKDVYCVDAQNCFAGGYGHFYRTFNGGDTILASSLGEISQFKSKFKIYPNPMNEQFYVAYSGQEQLQFQLYNLMGQKVEAAVQQAGNRYRFSVGHLPKGVYLLRVSDGVRDEMLKVVKD